MTSAQDFSARLQTAVNLAQTVEHHEEAHQLFKGILADLQGQDSPTVVLLEQLWQEYISLQRSSLFWQQLSQAEKNLSDRLTESHLQLKQNYLRLMQEQ
jgi:C4-type Zn-finger protein